MDKASPSIGRRVAKGALWTVFMRLSIRLIGLASTIVLARLLVPGDFGLVALATMLIALVDLVGDLNVAVYLIQEQKTKRAHFDTAWTMSAIKGVATTIVLILLAPFIAVLFDDARLEAVVYVLAFVGILDGGMNIGVIEFQKSLSFDKDFRLMVWPKIISATVTIVLAILWRDYWALVIGILSNKASQLVLSYAMHPFRPRPSLAKLGEVFGFSKWLLANNILQFLGRRSDTVIIGKILNAGSLGLYTLAKEVSELTSTELLQPIHRALYPGLAKLGNDPARLRRAFVDSLGVTAIVGLPLAAGLGLVANPMVRLVLGPKWFDAIPVIQILAIAGTFRVLTGNSRAFLFVIKRPHLATALTTAGAVLSIALLPYAVWAWGIIGAGWARAAAAGVLLLINYVIICRICEVPVRSVCATVWRPVMGCLVMAAAIDSLARYWPPGDTVSSLFVALSCAVVLGASSYAATTLALWRLAGAPAGAEQRLFGMIREYFDARRAGGLSGKA